MNAPLDMAKGPLVSAPELSENDAEAAPGTGAEPVAVTVAGQQYIVPKAIADALSAGGMVAIAPDHYSLRTRPEYETEGYSVSEDHPLYGPACDWCRKNGVSQEAFDELAALFQDHEFSSIGHMVDFRNSEMRKLIEGFAPGMDPSDPMAESAAIAKAMDDQRWLLGLLGPAAREQPAIGDVIADLYTLSDGAHFVRALRDAIGERTPGTLRAGAGSAAPQDMAALIYNHPTSR